MKSENWFAHEIGAAFRALRLLAAQQEDLRVLREADGLSTQEREEARADALAIRSRSLREVLEGLRNVAREARRMREELMKEWADEEAEVVTGEQVEGDCEADDAEERAQETREVQPGVVRPVMRCMMHECGKPIDEDGDCPEGHQQTR